MNRIEDFGQKIGGAKKDNWKDRAFNMEDLESLEDREAYKFCTKETVWPKMDYVKLFEGGMDAAVLYLLKKVRDSAPSSVKPSGDEKKDKERRKIYIELLNNIQNAVLRVRTKEDLRCMLAWAIDDNGYYDTLKRRWTEKGRGCAEFLPGRLLKALQPSPWGIKVAEGESRRCNFPYRNEAWREDIRIIEAKGEGFAVAKNSLILKDGFKSREEAEKYIAGDLKARLSPGKKVVKIARPQLACIERTGEDYRRGRDISTDKFMKAFDFRGGEFGNWQTQEDRRQCLNLAYDALKDLAAVLVMEDGAVSLNGELAIAFGSRGSGTAAAHYEPSKKVFNLTKMSGAGCTAHEWAHALDDFYGRLSGDKKADDPYVSSGVSLMKSKLDSEVIQAFSDVMDMITRREMTNEEVNGGIRGEILKIQKYIESWLDPVMEHLKNAQPQYKKDPRRAATEMEMKLAKELGNRIKSGAECEKSLEELNKLHKCIKGILLDKKYRNGISNNIFHLERNMSLLKSAERMASYGETDYLKNAEAIDKTREKPYWSTRPELFARAFESYVEDKLAEKGLRSQYLVHSTQNSLYGVKPYPEGEERKAINRAFDSLISVLGKDERWVKI